MQVNGRYLAYTIAFDPPQSPGHRAMAKMLAGSLMRTYFDGDFVIFRNSEEPLFRLERKGIEEIYLPTPELHGLSGAEYSWCWKYRVRDYLKCERYEKVIFLDCDTLVLRNIDHLLEGDWDIAYQPERELPITRPQFSCFLTDKELETLKCSGVNSGTIAVRSEILQEVMTEWDRIDTGPTTRERNCSDQGSWNLISLPLG